MDQKLIDKLNKRKLEGTLRSLSFAPDFIDFYSNDYLGKATIEFPTNIKGSSGSRLISGHSENHQILENEIADFFQVQSSLFFESGFSANLGFFSCVPQRGDLVLFDEECHTSIKDGLRLSLADKKSFRHNDLDHLNQLLEKKQKGVYVVIESLYSMSGTLAPITEILALAEKFGASVVIDEAHASGILGENFKGVSIGLNHPSILARIITFGKAYGASGAVILSSSQMREYLINFCRTFIYTTAAPISLIEKALHQLKHPKSEDLSRLAENIEYFKNETKSWKCQSDKCSPIQMIHFGSRAKLLNCAQLLAGKKISCKPIFAPTVNEENEGMRVSLHSFNTKAEIDVLIAIIESCL
ncbi:MAG: pyridoxal phosphate-dependent aminotransferase family protein [Bacteroidetes bacterium]|nr:pyridoxal phosphate-dependent aminotransferase family protein [Bacteroidota bacterium]